jgi:hypothetical protein
VREHILEQWIESGIVNIGNKHTFPEIIENHDSWTCAQSAKRFMRFGPPVSRNAASVQAGLMAVSGIIISAIDLATPVSSTGVTHIA